MPEYNVPKHIPGIDIRFTVDDGGCIYKNGVIAPQAVGSNGKYLYVSVKLDSGKWCRRTVYSLVCTAFKGKRPGKDDCSHLDNNWRNNKPINLVWESRSVNCKRKVDHGTHDRGCKNKRAALNRQQLFDVRKCLREGKTQKWIATKFNVGVGVIQKISDGTRYKPVCFEDLAPPKILAIDFDNTIVHSTFPVIHGIKEGAIEALTLFKELGYYIVIWSCRAGKWLTPEYFKHKAEYDNMVNFLNENKIPYDEIDSGEKGKPYADYYIDDKAVSVRDNWAEVADFVKRNTK